MYIDHTYNKLAAAFEIIKKFADSKWRLEIDLLENLHFSSIGSVKTSLECFINCLDPKKTNSFLIHIDSYNLPVYLYMPPLLYTPPDFCQFF